ncbi:MAG: recombinase family protein, partial [Clostridia bacterium]|nr:recombinase family protein [Clostridia bacterium]
MAKLTTDRAMILEELREDQKLLIGTEELEKERKRLAEQMNVDADAVQEAIAENARVAQNQEEYSIRYENPVSPVPG